MYILWCKDLDENLANCLYFFCTYINTHRECDYEEKTQKEEVEAT